MEDYGLITKETLKDLIFEKFEKIPDYPKTAEEEDPLIHVNTPDSPIASLQITSSEQHVFHFLLPPPGGVWGDQAAGELDTRHTGRQEVNMLMTVDSWQ